MKSLLLMMVMSTYAVPDPDNNLLSVRFKQDVEIKSDSVQKDNDQNDEEQNSIKDTNNATSLQSHNMGNRMKNIENLLKNMMTILSNGSRVDECQDNLENKMEQIETSLQNMMTNLNNGSRMEEFQGDLEMKINHLEDRLRSLEDNLTHKLDYMIKSQGCPSEWIPLGPTKCFKLLYDKARTWMEAKDACNKFGCNMAKPDDPVMLRKHLIATYGVHSGKGYPWTWVAARGGSGSDYYWDEQVGGGRIVPGDPFWYPNHPGSNTGSSYCLFMLNNDGHMKAHPNQPYRAAHCTSYSHYYALCEYIKE